MQVTAMFAGSFDPFTIGHADIVTRALAMFDRVIVAIGHNAAKADADLAARVETIRRLYAGNPRVSVETYDGLTVDAARALGATVLVRGVRSVRDFEYERDLADINRRVGGIDTVLIPARPELTVVSSSMVRELRSYGHDVEPFLPK